MHPPISTTLALIEQSLRPLTEALSHIKSFNGTVVFMRDHHYPDMAAVIASHPARVPSKRLQFVRSNIEQRSVDLRATTLGTTFASQQSTIGQSRMNRAHIVWGGYVPLPAHHEAVVQLAFDKTVGAAPAITTIEKVWDACKDEITHSLHELAVRHEVSLIDACKLDVPVTPNAFVIKWDIMDSHHTASNNYATIRHFITTFERTIEPLVSYHGGHIAGYRGDSQNIILPLPSDVDPNNLKVLRHYANTTVMRLVEKIRVAHTTITATYSPPLRIRLGVGMGWIETSQLGEETGPVLWSISSKMKMRASNSEMFTLCVDDSVKNIVT